MRALLEIAVDTIEGARTAIAAGADRIELCAALSEGGLTPSAGMMQAMSEFAVPVFAMIRPRGGDFAYSADELRIMRHDVQMARDCGMSGLVFGALRRDGALDADVLAELLALSGGLPATLHRAFDLAPDQHMALEQAILLGFRRVLSSGQALEAVSGAARLAELVQQAGERLIVMPGAGIRAASAATILAATGAREIHAACGTRAVADQRLPAFGFAGAGGPVRTDGAAVAALRRALEQATAEQVPA